jgi:uncharacterized small protein (DUF1192 family)
MPGMSNSDIKKLLDAENKRLINENNNLRATLNHMVLQHNDDVKKISYLKTDIEDLQEEIERLKQVCSNMKHGKNAQIVALDKEVDALKADLAEEKAYTEKSLHYANNNEIQLITENNDLKRRLDIMTLNEKYPTNADAGAYAYALADAKKSLAEKTVQLDIVNQKLINVQKAVIAASIHMTEAITTN